MISAEKSLCINGACTCLRMFYSYRLCFLIEFWLTSAASRQNSSEQNGRSTYCAARQAPPRSGGYREAVHNGVWQIANLHFYPFLTVREICLHHHTPPFLLGCSPLELADISQALIHIALFCALLCCTCLRCNQRKHGGHGKHPLTVLTAEAVSYTHLTLPTNGW